MLCSGGFSTGEEPTAFVGLHASSGMPVGHVDRTFIGAAVTLGLAAFFLALCPFQKGARRVLSCYRIRALQASCTCMRLSLAAAAAAEMGKSAALRSKLEALCRELQAQNKAIIVSVAPFACVRAQAN